MAIRVLVHMKNALVGEVRCYFSNLSPPFPKHVQFSGMGGAGSPGHQMSLGVKAAVGRGRESDSTVKLFPPIIIYVIFILKNTIRNVKHIST